MGARVLVITHTFLLFYKLRQLMIFEVDVSGPPSSHIKEISISVHDLMKKPVSPGAVMELETPGQVSQVTSRNGSTDYGRWLMFTLETTSAFPSFLVNNKTSTVK